MPNFLKDAVYEALDNSLANGDDPRDQIIDDIIADLQSYDQGLENCTYGELRPHVESWLEENGR